MSDNARQLFSALELSGENLVLSGRAASPLAAGIWNLQADERDGRMQRFGIPGSGGQGTARPTMSMQFLKTLKPSDSA